MITDPNEARTYLSSQSLHRNRPGDTGNLHPDFALKLANAIQQARAEGLQVGVMSGFRTPGQTGSAYDAGGNSSHSYGLASDISGLDGPNGRVTTRWAQIAGQNGLSNPYGVGNAAEFNHWQLPPQPLERTPDQLARLKAAAATGNYQNVWNAYGGGGATPAAPQPEIAFTAPPNAPAGMRNNNPLNIKYVSGAPFAGVVGPSQNTDQGDPQMVFQSQQHGMNAGYQLLSRKYDAGKITPNQIIAGQGGWTPGNFAAAGKVAANMGIGPDEDIRFSDPARAKSFMRALLIQEQGNAGNAYPDAMIERSVSGKFTPSSGTAGAAAAPTAGGGGLGGAGATSSTAMTPAFVPPTPQQSFDMSIGQALASLGSGGSLNPGGGGGVSRPDAPAIRTMAMETPISTPSPMPADFQPGGLSSQLASLVGTQQEPSPPPGLTDGAPSMTSMLPTVGTSDSFNYLDPRRTVSPPMSFRGVRLT